MSQKKDQNIVSIEEEFNCIFWQIDGAHGESYLS